MFKWLLAAATFSACTAAAVSRLAKIAKHRERGGPMMTRRIFGSLGVGLASLGWAAAVALLMGVVKRGPRNDWFLLGAAAAVSCFMAWSLLRAESIEKMGGGLSDRQRDAAEELSRVRREILRKKSAEP